jgi:peptidoglycan/xylan/chitin deacetylase (PgdA/CDA1 family)
VRGKRELMIRMLGRAGLVGGVLRARRRVGLPWLTVLNYHRVGHRGAIGELDDGVLDATPEQFDHQLSVLREHFEVVGLEDVVAWLRGAPLPPNPAMVTFDDGYLDCITTALPILKKHAVPATFFIASSYIEERRLFWWDHLSLLLRRSRRESLELTVPQTETLPLGDALPRTLRHLLQVVKKVRGLDLERFLDDVARAADVSISPEEERHLVDRYLMTWDDIAKVAAAGMDIGSHTRTHRILQTLDDGPLRDELEGSRRDLEEHLGRRVTSIAYPVGYSVLGEQRIVRALAAAGYEVGFSAHTGASWTVVPPSRWNIRRMATDVEHSEEYFRATVALPGLARLREARAEDRY